MAYIQLPVPEEYVPEVYELLASLGREEAATAGAESDDGAAEKDGPPPLSEELVIRMYRESWEDGAHQQLMEHLASVAQSDGDRWVRSSELMQVLDKSRGQLRGVFGAFGRRANYRYDGAKPWDAEWDHNAGEYGYRVTPEVAAAIRTAQAAS